MITPIPGGILCGPCMDLDTAIPVFMELIHSSAVGRFLQEAVSDCSFWGTIFECTTVDLLTIQIYQYETIFTLDMLLINECSCYM